VSRRPTLIAILGYLLACGLTARAACAGGLYDPTEPPASGLRFARRAFTVEGILCHAGRSVAIVDDALVHVGDDIEGRLVRDITPEGVLYTRGGRSHLAPAPAPPLAGCGAAAMDALPAGEARFAVDVANAPARLLFEGLAEIASDNILVRPEVTGSVTMSLRGVTLPQVLDAVRELNGYDFSQTAAGYLILPATLQTRIFHISYLDMQRYGVSNTRIDSGQVTQGTNTQYGSGAITPTQTQSTATVGPKNDRVTIDTSGTSILTRSDSDFWGDLTVALKATVANRPGCSVVVDPQSGMIVVRAFPDQLQEVAEYLRETEQTVTQQVVLEAKIVEVDLSHAYQAGIDWVKILQSGSSHYFIGQSSPQGPAGFQSNPLAPAGIPVTVAPGNPVTGFVNNSLGGAFTLAVDLTDFNAFIQLLSAEGQTHVLSSPRVATLDNQKAVIKAGTDQFYVTGIQSETTTATATSTSNNVILTPFFSGVALDVTPQIAADGEILLHIHPIVSEVTTQTVTFQVQGQPDTLPLAQSTVRESDSIVRTRSGQVVVIGGLMQDKIARAQYKTPLLGDVPGLGRLFRSEQDQKSKIELVVLLRALTVGGGGLPAPAPKDLP